MLSAASESTREKMPVRACLFCVGACCLSKDERARTADVRECDTIRRVVGPSSDPHTN